MSSNIAIKVNNISKMYHLYKQPQDRLKQAIYPKIYAAFGKQPKNYYREFWALRNISFEINKGETVGIVGRNGSGKSTLLQLVCRTLTPTTGSIHVDGRLTALLELGSGFNPEFTGRENVYLAGSILGFSKQEMDYWFDDIAAFADIGDFMEQPVKLYSSGMYVRLAFATNIMVQPDVMIIDEALSVGDMKFQVKCMSALRRKQEAGASILFVSHNINTVKSLCTRAIYLDAGELQQTGPADEVANIYFKKIRNEIDADLQKINKTPGLKQEKTNHTQAAIETDQQEVTREIKDLLAVSEADFENFEKSSSLFRLGTGEARIRYAELIDENGQPINNVEFNQSVRVRFVFESYEHKTLTANFYILDDKGIPITGSNLMLSNHPLLSVKPGEQFLVEYYLNALPLQDGIYSLNVSLLEPTVISGNAPTIYVDYIENVVVFNMSPRKPLRTWSKVFLFPSVKIRRL